MISPLLFQSLLLSWFQKHGRKHLPWQHPRTPYRVWVSEVMLQQTQVATVIPYFERFMQHFPTTEALSKASEDVVLHLWAGLGYYARARHLHHTAQKIMRDFEGEFPSDLTSLQSLPGIGRSTAGAILSLGFSKPAPILDGNVKRLFSRLHAIEGCPKEAKVAQKLWNIAEEYISLDNPCDYTQALMDFGTLVCTKQNPDCKNCPFMHYCLAYRSHKTSAYPQSKPKRALPSRKTYFLIFINENQKVFLQKRPPVGIWGGLWSTPESTLDTDITTWCEENYHLKIESITSYPTIQHTFSHFRLMIEPILFHVQTKTRYTLQEGADHGWFQEKEWDKKGLAAPIKKLLKRVFKDLSPSG